MGNLGELKECNRAHTKRECLASQEKKGSMAISTAGPQPMWMRRNEGDWRGF